MHIKRAVKLIKVKFSSMVSPKAKRLSKVAREFNVGISTIVEFLNKKGYNIEGDPNAKVSPECLNILEKEYSKDIELKKEKEKVSQRVHKTRKETITIDDIGEQEKIEEEESSKDQHNDDIIIIKDTGALVDEKRDQVKKTPKKKEEVEEIKIEKPKPEVKVVGKIDLEKKAEKEEKKEEKEQKIEKQEEIIEPEKVSKKESEEIKESIPEKQKKTDEKNIEEKEEENTDVKVVGKIDLDSLNQKTRPKKKTKAEKIKEKAEKEKVEKEIRKKQVEKEEEKVDKKEIIQEKEQKTQELVDKKDQKVEKTEEFIETKVKKLDGPTVVGKIELPTEKKKTSSNNQEKKRRKKKRKRIIKEPVDIDKKQAQNKDKQDKKPHRKNKKFQKKKEIDENEVQKQIKETLARLTSKGKSKGVKHRREKREEIRTKQQALLEEMEKEKSVIKVTEFVTANELANLMDVPVTKIIEACMSLGLFVSINQRLDAETISVVSEEFGYTAEFISADVQEAIVEEEDDEEDLVERPPIVTVMGHVDHGKTSLLDYIRDTNIIAGEAGGITQHIGAYNVTLKNGKRITFLDTPGHESFTAMRARGAQVTDLAIIVIAADDKVMPQTIEAINHAKAAGVPIIFAINKIDRPNANPDKIKEELANMNYLVEEWGGKYQSKDISAKTGENVEDLMEEVFLAAELLELKANPNKKAVGTVIEASLDKGRGYSTTVLISNGTLKIGDVILAGSQYGKVKALFNERNHKIEKIGPGEPGVVLGLNGAPNAGDKLNVMNSDKEAREIATKRQQLQREQDLRTKKHITLDEIGRRLAIGNFQEFNIIVKGDVDGSVEALTDSLLKLSSDEIQVNVIHKGVGQIVESDVMLAIASNAVIIGFQVRPSLNARKLAEKEDIEIRLYSIIYDAINEIKDAISGMLVPKMKEKITANVEVLQIFKISKVGTVAGCIVREGKIHRNSNVRVIRDGIVVYTGTLGSLKRFKEDVKEVSKGFECGLNIDKFNDIKVGDIIEAYEEVEA